MRALVLAGIVIAALGVLDDVTVSQASTVLALRRANPRLSTRRLFREAMAVGRDHVGATVNTLVLAYAGASLPILLIFASQGTSFTDAINREAVAEENRGDARRLDRAGRRRAARDGTDGAARHAAAAGGHPDWRPRALVKNARAMRVSAKADYAVRAAVELAAAGADSSSPLKLEQVVAAHGIPFGFLQNVMDDLRSAGLVRSRTGPYGGYWLARAPADVSVADVIRAAGGLLGGQRGREPSDLDYAGNTRALGELWRILSGVVDGALETVTLADIVKGELPGDVRELPPVFAPTKPRRDARGRRRPL